MAVTQSKELTIINDEQVEPTQVQFIVFDNDYTEYEKDGVNKTLNGYNFCLIEILQDMKNRLTGELQGAKVISKMKPNTLLCCEDLDLNEDLYLDMWGVENPVITLSDKDITRANYTVQKYEYLLGIVNSMLKDTKEIETPKYELLP